MEIQANWVRQEQLEREYLDVLSSSMNWIASTKANVYPLAHTKFLIYTTDEAINKIHEKFLHYNGIDPVDVTLEAGERLVC